MGRLRPRAKSIASDSRTTSSTSPCTKKVSSGIVISRNLNRSTAEPANSNASGTVCDSPASSEYSCAATEVPKEKPASTHLPAAHFRGVDQFDLAVHLAQAE